MSFPKNALSGARLALAALLACAALPAQAEERTYLRPLLEVEQGWDSNIYNDSDDEQGSLVTRISPALWLENTGELGSARLGLIGIGRSVWEDSELSGIDGLARGEFDRRLTPRLTLFGNAYLEHYSGYDEVDPDGLNQGDQPILSEQPSWKRDLVGLGFRYMLTERLSMSLSGSAGRVNYERIDGNFGTQSSYRDSTELDGRSALLYQLTALDQVSLSVDYDDTTYQNLGAGTNDSAIWSSEVGWTRNWTQAWMTSARIGFSLLDAEQRGVPQSGGYAYYATCTILGLEFPCPQSGFEPLGQTNFKNSSTGLIGSVAIRRAFARSSLQLQYDRDTRSTGGSARTNFDIDSFTLSWTQRLAERVRLTLSGNYSLYHSVNDELPDYPARVRAFENGTFAKSCSAGGVATDVAEFPNPVDPDELIPVVTCVGGSSEEKREYTTLVGRLDWQLRRTLSTFAVARYYHSITDQTLGDFGEIRTEDLDKFYFGVGFRYHHDLGL